MSVDELVAFAKQKEGLFDPLDEERPDGLENSPPSAAAAEPFAATQARLDLEIGKLSEELQRTSEDDEDVVDGLRSELYGLMKAKSVGGGMDASGRIVIGDMAALVALAKPVKSNDQSSPKEPNLAASEVLEEEALAGLDPTPADDQTVAEWPEDAKDPRVIEALADRSHGFGRISNTKGFRGYSFMGAPPPFCFVPLRPNLEREAPQGPLQPADLARLEVGSGYEVEMIGEQSPVLGRGHVLMLPPHTSMEWYGRTLGWGDQDVRKIASFGNAAKPETISRNGDGEKLLEAFRGVVEMQLRKLVSLNPSHLLADANDFGEAREDLARWWFFVLLARHDPIRFDTVMPDYFLHGVHGPDFVMENGKAMFGQSYFRLKNNHLAMQEGWMNEASFLQEGVGAAKRRRINPEPKA